MDLMLLATLTILAVVSMIAYSGLKNKQKIDSALRQRAVFNSAELITYTRLKEILPATNILAHVSFDALLTTKYLHTRRKYQKMFADFVVLDQDFKIIAVITLDDPYAMKWINNESDQDTLLEMAGYRVIRYHGVPEYQQLREDFIEHHIPVDESLSVESGLYRLYRRQFI